MFVLHHCVSARSFRALWLLEEVGQPYELRMWPFPPRQHARQFLQINPLGTIPLLEGEQVHMTESVAICQYLANRFGAGTLDVAPHEPGYSAYLNCLHMSDATLTFPQTLVLRYRYMETETRLQPQVAEDYERWFLARLRAVDAALSAGEFLCAQRFTAADVAVGYALMLAQHLGLRKKFPANVDAYWTRLQLRPAFVRSLSAQDRAARAQGVDPTPAPDIRPI